MPWYIRRAWLVQTVAEAGVECIVIDDAQDLNLAHLAFLKERDFQPCRPSRRAASRALPGHSTQREGDSTERTLRAA
jgi:hypothetical protein